MAYKNVSVEIIRSRIAADTQVSFSAPDFLVEYYKNSKLYVYKIEMSYDNIEWDTLYFWIWNTLYRRI